MSNFEWQTDDKDGWDTPPEKSGSARPLSQFVIIGVLIFVVTLIGLGAVFLGGQQVEQRIEDGVNKVEGDVARSFSLLYEASAAHDEELFNTVLSGRDLAWATPLQRQVKTAGLLDLSLFNLNREIAIPDVERIVLSPNLTAAEVWSTASYTWTTDTGEDASAVLRKSHIMRKGDGRWVYSPPTIAYWGELKTYAEGYPLYIENVRDRDAELASRLVDDLNQQLNEQCIVKKENCEGKRLGINFSTRPSTRVWGASYTAQTPATLLLPTPSLIGIPTNESGYQALLHAYGTLTY